MPPDDVEVDVDVDVESPTNGYVDVDVVGQLNDVEVDVEKNPEDIVGPTNPRQAPLEEQYPAVSVSDEKPTSTSTSTSTSLGLDRARDAIANGNVELVREIWSSASRDHPCDVERYQWFLLLLEAGAEAEATEVASSLVGTKHERSTRELLADIEEPRRGDDDDVIDLSVLRGPAPSSDARVTEAFLRWFGGRGDLYAQQWWDERRRRGGYRRVDEPLTPRVARSHLDGMRTVGQYLLFPDGTCSFGAIDLDLSANALAELRVGAGDDVSPAAHERLREYAGKILAAARDLGIPLWPEDSGNRGLHLWLLLEPRRPARAVRSLLGQIVASAGGQPPEVGVEIFPKQEKLGPKGLSSLVKLPLGLHRATLRRCPMLDDDFSPIVDPLASLLRLTAAPHDAVDEVVARRVFVPPTPEPAGPLPVLVRSKSPRTLADALRSIEPGKPERDACERVLTGCAVLRKLVRMTYEERRLEPAFARALCYTLGLIGPSCGMIDELFAVAQVSRKEVDRVRRGLPSPTGCKRLRRLELVGAPECPCSLGDSASPYPTPVLFAVGERLPAEPDWTPFAAWLEDVPDWSGDMITELVTRLRTIDRRLAKLEDR